MPGTIQHLVWLGYHTVPGYVTIVPLLAEQGAEWYLTALRACPLLEGTLFELFSTAFKVSMAVKKINKSSSMKIKT
jgi:hypothetical protein